MLTESVRKTDVMEVAGVLLIQGDEYVLQLRDNIPTISEPGLVAIWGGKVEENDSSPQEAAARELLEETGVEIDSSELVHLESYVTRGKSSKNIGKPVKAHIYYVEIPENVTVECLEGLELVRVKDLNEIPESLRSEFLQKSIEIV